MAVEEAATVFLDPLPRLYDDPDHSGDELFPTGEEAALARVRELEANLRGPPPPSRGRKRPSRLEKLA